MNDDNINSYVPSLLNPRRLKRNIGDGDISLTQNSCISRSSLSLRRNNGLKLSCKPKPKIPLKNKENSPNVQNLCDTFSPIKLKPKPTDIDSIGLSAIDDLQTVANNFGSDLFNDELNEVDRKPQDNTSLITISSNTELGQTKSDSTVIYNVTEKPTVSLSFGINQCQSVEINSNKSAIKRVNFAYNESNTQVDCEIVEGSKISSVSDLDENMNEPLTPNSLKRSAVTVNLEIKKKKPSPTQTEDKVLILNTSAIEKISHVIVQPPNYKLVKGKFLDRSKLKSVNKRKFVFAPPNRKVSDGLKQISLDNFFPKRTSFNNVSGSVDETRETVPVTSQCEKNVDEVMSRISGVSDCIKIERTRKVSAKNHHESCRSIGPGSPNRERVLRLEGKVSTSPVQGRMEASSSNSPVASKNRKHVEPLQFTLASPNKSATLKRSLFNNMPQHKIVAGTHFAVDAFSYGDIPNVKHYFLTHFHSDHYSGLRKSFNKILFCSKITADLCISRLGVSPKNIHVLKLDETIRIDDVEVTAVEANHCPGAVMLVFTLTNGKTLLHTGDFRATPLMESYPIFWNKDIHTVYLDTTYCNPRYDFPTQEQSLEMALHILRQKKNAMEKMGKKFSTVLIVCGTYTIGKEKFFLGMSRRVGCSVWACPEKDRVLQCVEGRTFALSPPAACQLHVVPMRDLTHEKLHSYLDSLNGAFSEVVAFKPSGWENGKSSNVEMDKVTIHGIPYSEHSSFSELVRFVKFLKPKQVVPTVDISGGVRAVQKFFPCPLVYKDELHSQSRVTDFFSIQNQQQVPAVT